MPHWPATGGRSGFAPPPRIDIGVAGVRAPKNSTEPTARPCRAHRPGKLPRSPCIRDCFSYRTRTLAIWRGLSNLLSPFSIALEGMLEYHMRMTRTFEGCWLSLCRLFWAGLLAGFGWPGFGQNTPPAEKPLLGFSRERAAEQRALEARFDSLLQREHLREWMKRLTAHPHHLGSAYDKQNAEFLAGQFRAWGYETQIEEFQVLFPTPKVRVLEMVEPERFFANLTEPSLPEDSTSAQIEGVLPVYNAYSIDGDVTGELVYVNYGVPKDYEVLERNGVDVKGRIVIARYGGCWRGIKPKVAGEHGAIGCIIYSDPHEDGYYQGDDYPRGAFRSGRGAQRGSVSDMPLYAGDPLTPDIGAGKDGKRLPIKEAPSLHNN